MAKLKVSVTEESWEQTDQDGIEPPKPGVYACRIVEANTGYSKGDDNKPDKDRPRVEVIYQVIDPKAKTKGNEGGSALNARLWQYLTFGDNVQWKLAQFLKAVGVPYKKVGKKLEFDLDTSKIAASISDVDPKTMKARPAKKTGHDGLEVRVKVRPGTNQDGDYRAEVGSVLPPKADGDADDDDDFAAADESEETMADDEAMADDDEAMDENGDEEAVGYAEDDLKAMTPAELKEVVAAFNEAGHELSIKGKKKSEVIAMILEAQAAATEESGDDESMDEEEFEPEDEEMADDDSDKYTEESLKAMDPSELKEVAKAHDVKFGGKKKSQVISEILAKQAADEDGDDTGDNPF